MIFIVIKAQDIPEIMVDNLVLLAGREILIFKFILMG